MFSCGDGCGSYVGSAVVEGHGDSSGRESMEQEMNGTDLDHGFGGCSGSFVVFAVAARAAIPGIGSLNDPSFANRTEALGSGGGRLHFDRPMRSFLRQPSVQGMVVILVVAEDHQQSWQLLGSDA